MVNTRIVSQNLSWKSETQRNVMGNDKSEMRILRKFPEILELSNVPKKSISSKFKYPQIFQKTTFSKNVYPKYRMVYNIQKSIFNKLDI